MNFKKIKDFIKGETIKARLMIIEKKLQPFKNKPGNYLTLQFRDSTGIIASRMWDGADAIFSSIDNGMVVEVIGQVDSYNDNLQFILSSITVISDGINPMDFIPAAENLDDIKDEFIKKLKELMNSMENKYLKKLLMKIFSKDFFNKYTIIPAAKKMHHGYLGGLMEHTLSIIKVCEKLTEVYPSLDKDLLITGALIHDIGKVEELICETHIDYSTQGHMLGHIIIGSIFVSGKIDEVAAEDEFPEDLRIKVIHMIVSHHGEYVFQSPKRPKIPEAYVLHMADMLDGDLYKFFNTEGDGMVYNQSLQRYIWAKSN